MNRGNRMSEESQRRALDVALKEFDSVRATMERRASSLLTLLSFNVTASAAIAGFVLSDHADPRVLLVLPLLSSGFGLLAINQVSGILTRRAYIKCRLAPLIREYAGDEKLMGWEDRETAWDVRAAAFAVQALAWGLLFLVVPAFGLAVTVIHLRSATDWAVWWSGTILLATTAVAWLMRFAGRTREASGDKADLGQASSSTVGTGSSAL